MPVARRTALGTAALLLAPPASRAPEFPTRALRLNPPYPPGGGTDTVARLLAPHMTARLGQNIVLVNRGGAGAHLAADQFMRLAGIELIHVPYRGGGPAMTDLVAGNVAMAFASASAATAHVQGGRLRALGAAGKARIGAFPAMPTLAEQGVTSYGFDLWNGLWTVAGTPQAAIAKLRAATLFALAQPDVQARFARIGIGAVGSPQAEFAAFVGARRDRAARLIRDANMTLG